METLARNIKKSLVKKGATDAIVAVTKNSSDQIKFSNNLISTTQTWNSTDVSLFISIKNKLASTALKAFDKKTIDSTTKKLIKIAKLSKANSDFFGIAAGPFKYKKIEKTFDKKINKIDKVKILQESISESSKNGAKKNSGVLETSVSSIYLTTSSDVIASAQGTNIHLSLRALASKEASGHMTCSSRVLSEFDYKKASKIAGIIAKDSRRQKFLKSGKYDIIFHPLAFANLLSFIGNAASIFSVESGLSFLSNRLNEKVASKIVDFYDDPTIPNGIGSIPFDAEGHPTMKKAIIENGVFKTYLHNTSSARKYKTKTTANAGIIAPQPFNLILRKSDWKQDEMIKETKKGIIVTNLWYTRFKNYLTGEFSTIPRDGIFLIENGKVKNPVKGIRISDTLPNILGNIMAVGIDSKQITSWETEIPTTTPSVLVKNINITKPIR